MTLSRYDFEIALTVLIASIIASVFYPVAVVAVICAALNLYHQRHIEYAAGRTFTARVRDALSTELQDFEKRFETMEKRTADVRGAYEQQMIIKQATRGY
jgi:hypothetical protein